MSNKSLLKLTVSENVDTIMTATAVCSDFFLSLYPPEMLKCTDVLNSKDTKFCGHNKTQEHVPLKSSVMERAMCSCDSGDENKQGKST